MGETPRDSTRFDEELPNLLIHQMIELNQGTLAFRTDYQRQSVQRKTDRETYATIG
jgi:hypothetical protein